jgi:vitamin B12 transporter
VLPLPRAATQSLVASGVLVIVTLGASNVQADPHGSSAVVVTVSGEHPSLPESTSAPTAAVTVLAKHQLSRAGDTAADVLRHVPGVQVTRSGGTTDPATASIRGADAKQVPIYLAGVRLNDEVNGAADLSSIPLWMMRRVEIFRGNAPAYQTELGLGGAIYFDPVLPRETRLGVEAHVGSFGRRGGSIHAQVGNRDSSALISLRSSSIDNDYTFVNDHGLRYADSATEERRVNADAHDVDGWAIGSHTLGRVRLNTLLHVFDREQGTSGIATTPAHSARSRNRRLMGAVSGTYSCPTAWSCLVVGQASWLTGHETIRDPDRELRTVRADWLHTRGTRTTASMRAALGLTDFLKLTPLTTLAYDGLQVDTSADSPREAARTTTTFGLETTAQPSDDLSIFGMARGACYDTRAEYIRLARRREDETLRCPAAPDARLGVEYHVARPLRLLANVGHVWREPTLGERYGVSAALQGNDQLKPERTYSVDVGTRGVLRGSTAGIEWDAFVFRRFSNDLVRYRQTSLYAFSPFNVGETVVSGAELSVSGRLPWGFTTHSTLTLTDPRDVTPGRRTTNDVLPMTSRLTTYHELTWTYRVSDAVLRETSLGGRYFFRSSRFADPGGLVVLPAVQSIDLHGTATFVNPNLELSVALNNLIDQRMVDYLGLPVPGRSFHLSLSSWW